MNQKLLLIFVAVVFVLGGLFYVYNPEPIEYTNPGGNPPGDQIPDAELPTEDNLPTVNTPPADGEQVFCAADARQCPDGTWVGRTEPNCQFICPGDKPLSE